MFDGSAGSGIGIVRADGRCVSCGRESPSLTARGSAGSFSSSGSLVTFISRGALWQIGLGGSGLRRLRSGPFTDAVWSSTGTLAVVRGGRVLIDSAGPGALRSLGGGAHPSFSPDGAQIALVRAGWVWLVRVRDGRSLRLVSGRAPAWSPDGQGIAYIGARGAGYVIPARGGRSRRVARVRGTSLDWQPVPPSPRCNLKGATVLATSATAVVYSRVVGQPGDTNRAWYGCLRSVGRVRLLVSGPSVANTESLRLERVALAGRYAAFAFFFNDQYFTDDTETVDVYDLSTGRRAPTITTSCRFPYEPCGIDSLVVNASGFVAWHLPETVPVYHFAAISCPSASFCVAVDDYGNALTATNPASGATAWARANIDGTDELTGVSCPSAQFCVAVDAEGRVLTSTDPAGGAGAWTAIDVDGVNPLAAVSCSSSALCVAVDRGGRILALTDPTGGAGAWTAAPVDSAGPLAAVSCPSVALCVAVDGAGRIFTSTTPAAGPATWTSRVIAGLASNDPSPAFTAVSCPSVSLCVATGVSLGGLSTPGIGPPPGGRAVVATNPTGDATAWISTPLAPPFSDPLSVSCASVSLCVIAGSEGMHSSTNPPAGQSSWSLPSLSGGSLAAEPGISCPTASLCAVVDTQGNVITSANPSGGTSAWIATSVDVPPCAGTAVCQDEHIYARDSNGTRLIDNIKFPGTGQSLTHLKLTGDQLRWTDNGSPRSATWADVRLVRRGHESCLDPAAPAPQPSADDHRLGGAARSNLAARLAFAVAARRWVSREIRPDRVTPSASKRPPRRRNPNRHDWSSPG